MVPKTRAVLLVQAWMKHLQPVAEKSSASEEPQREKDAEEWIIMKWRSEFF